MKKTLYAILLAFCFTAVSVFAQSEDAQTTQEPKSSSYEQGPITYHNVLVFKVFDHKDAVIVAYADHNRGMKQVTIPKTWSQNIPRKLEYRPCPKGINPFMTVYYKDNAFYKVVLTVPPATNPDNLWAVAPSHFDVGDVSSIESIKLEF